MQTLCAAPAESRVSDMYTLTFTYSVQYRLSEDVYDHIFDDEVPMSFYWSEEFDEDFDALQPLGIHDNICVNKLLQIWEQTVDSRGDYLGIRIFDSMMLDRPKLFYSGYPEAFRDAPAKLSEYGLIELAMSVLHELHKLGVDQAEPVSQFRL